MTDILLKDEFLDGYADISGNYEDLWWNFCHSIAIESRNNPKLQRQFAPIKIRKNMVEFSENI